MISSLPPTLQSHSRNRHDTICRCYFSSSLTTHQRTRRKRTKTCIVALAAVAYSGIILMVLAFNMVNSFQLLHVVVPSSRTFSSKSSWQTRNRRCTSKKMSRTKISCSRVATTRLGSSMYDYNNNNDETNNSENYSYNRRQQEQKRQPTQKRSSFSSSSSSWKRDRKTQRQLEWILYTVMKTNQQQQQLQGSDETAIIVASNDLLVQALTRLVHAKTSLQVAEAGRLLQDAVNVLWQQLTNNSTTATSAISLVNNSTTRSSDDDDALLFWDIQERLVKATSMTGLIHVACNITNRMLDDNAGGHHFPSIMAQDAICTSLRRANKLECLENLILQLGTMSLSLQQQRQQQRQDQELQNLEQKLPAQDSAATTCRHVSLSAFNSYLAAMSDIIMDNKKKNWQHLSQQQQQQQYSSLSFRNDQNSRAALMEKCWQWIASGGTSSSNSDNNNNNPPLCVTQLGVEPDAVSFATVLQAAAAIGNETLTHLLWDEMIHCRSIQPNIVAYNARLRMAIKSLSQTQLERDENVLSIWYNEIQKDAHVQPDRYTIDLLLLPLTRQGRIGQVQDLLDGFVLASSNGRNSKSCNSSNNHAQQQRRRQQQQHSLVSEAFCAFFQTLVQGGEVAMARDLFDNYILPALSPDPNDAQNDNQRILVVHPTTRHFNVLLDGYRRLLQQQHQEQEESNKANDYDSTDVEIESQKCSHKDGWALFNLMLNQTSSQKVRPDGFTFTSMMGLCTTPGELSDLLKLAVDQYGIDCSSAVLRAAITAFGGLGDASSACWLFAQFACPIRLAPPSFSSSFLYSHQNHCQPATLREWNVLLGALSHAAEQNTTLRLNVAGAQVARTMSNAMDAPYERSLSTNHHHPLTMLVNGYTCSEAACLILDAMGNSDTENTGITFQLPRPNSQSYCLVATALQHDDSGATTTSTTTKANEALQLFRRAISEGTAADGRFLNAIFRCFGPDIDAALAAWKTEIRSACVAHENRRRSRPPPVHRKQGKNLVAAYHGLLYCSGRAQRADIALRIVYAMTKEGLEPSETALNVYQAGKRRQNELMEKEGKNIKSSSLLARKLSLADPYESLLYVECTKYNRADQRRAGEKRVRIIV